MIITRKTAEQLIKAGKAHCVGHTTTASDWAQRDYGHTYAIIDRYDEQRTDHCIDDLLTVHCDRGYVGDKKRCKELTMACWWSKNQCIDWHGVIGELQGLAEQHPETKDVKECLQYALRQL